MVLMEKHPLIIPKLRNLLHTKTKQKEQSYYVKERESRAHVKLYMQTSLGLDSLHKSNTSTGA